MSKVEIPARTIQQWECMALQMVVALEKIAKGAHYNVLPRGTFVDAEVFLHSACGVVNQRFFGEKAYFLEADLANFSFAQRAFECVDIRLGEGVIGCVDIEILVLTRFVRRLNQPNIFEGPAFEQSLNWAIAFFKALAALPD